jgi:hypothetical protein
VIGFDDVPQAALGLVPAHHHRAERAGHGGRHRGPAA